MFLYTSAGCERADGVSEALKPGYCQHRASLSPWPQWCHKGRGRGQPWTTCEPPRCCPGRWSWRGSRTDGLDRQPAAAERMQREEEELQRWGGATDLRDDIITCTVTPELKGLFWRFSTFTIIDIVILTLYQKTFYFLESVTMFVSDRHHSDCRRIQTQFSFNSRQKKKTECSFNSGFSDIISFLTDDHNRSPW